MNTFGRSASLRSARLHGAYAGKSAGHARDRDGASAIARTFATDHRQRIPVKELISRLLAVGIGLDDPWVREVISDVKTDGDDGLTPEQFTSICDASGGLVRRALCGDLVIPDFPTWSAS